MSATSPPLHDAALRRFRFVYVVLTALYELVLGIVIPIRVLNFEARSLSAANIALMVGLWAVTIGALELPTGGIADAWGRRRTMMVATATAIIGFATIALTASIGLLVVGVLFCALGSALGSGPLEAWYVDRAGEHGDVDTMPAFTSAAVVSNVAVAVGAVIAAVMPSLFDSLPERGSATLIRFSPVFAAAILCMVIRLVVVAVWMDDEPHRRAESTASGWQITREGTLSVARDDGLRRLFAVMVAVGVVSVTFDIVVPLGLENDPSIARPNAVFAVLFGLSMLGTAAGAAVAPRLAGPTPDNKRSTAHVSMFCGTAALTAQVPGSLGLSLGYFLLWACSGPLMPLFQASLHQRVEARQRATVVSAMSLATMLGAGAAAGLVSLLDSFVSQRQLLAGGAAVMISAGVYALGGASLSESQLPPSEAVT